MGLFDLNFSNPLELTKDLNPLKSLTNFNIDLANPADSNIASRMSGSQNSGGSFLDSILPLDIDFGDPMSSLFGGGSDSSSGRSSSGSPLDMLNPFGGGSDGKSSGLPGLPKLPFGDMLDPFGSSGSDGGGSSGFPGLPFGDMLNPFGPSGSDSGSSSGFPGLPLGDLLNPFGGGSDASSGGQNNLLNGFANPFELGKSIVGSPFDVAESVTGADPFGAFQLGRQINQAPFNQVESLVGNLPGDMSATTDSTIAGLPPSLSDMAQVGDFPSLKVSSSLVDLQLVQALEPLLKSITDLVDKLKAQLNDQTAPPTFGGSNSQQSSMPSYGSNPWDPGSEYSTSGGCRNESSDMNFAPGN